MVCLLRSAVCAISLKGSLLRNELGAPTGWSPTDQVHPIGIRTHVTVDNFTRDTLSLDIYSLQL